MPSPGKDIDIVTFYSASATNDGLFGYARQLSVRPTALASGSPAIVTLASGGGAPESYFDDGPGGLAAQTLGVFDSLVKDVANSLWKETSPEGILSAYPLDTAGHTTTIAYREDDTGNWHTFAYASGNLATQAIACIRGRSHSPCRRHLL